MLTIYYCFLFFLAMSDFKDDRFFLEISDQQGRPIQLPDSERKVIGQNSSLQDKGQPVLVQLGSERHYGINVILTTIECYSILLIYIINNCS